ncbi:MAG: VOC family protein [Rhodospirillales bacterium]|nr:MAG: VOC family protein [Rhodospirillales bacterium]
MPLTKVTDLAYVRLGAPDLDAMETFLVDFGLIRAARTENALYMRGTDSPHHVHIAEKGPPRFLAIGYHAGSMADLERLAAAPGASAVEAVDDPGGGHRVRLREPNGYAIEVVHGMLRLDPIAAPRQLLNSGDEPLRRAGRLMRLPPSPAPVKRIGHAVLSTPIVAETVKWFRDTLGFIGSDDVYAGAKENVIGSFNRLDRGDEYVDHHVFFAVHNDRAGLNHVSYEVPDVDAVLKDHAHLKSLGRYEHMWGVGRHLLGSQVYDYWSDPWGRVHERWADTDRLNASDGSNLLSVEDGFQSQWGEPPPEKFLRNVSQ